MKEQEKKKGDDGLIIPEKDINEAFQNFERKKRGKKHNVIYPTTQKINMFLSFTLSLKQWTTC